MLFKLLFKLLPLIIIAGIVVFAANTEQGRQIINSFASNPDSAPVGYQDSPDAASCVLYGWTCDADKYSQPLSIHIYEDSKYVGQTTANTPNEPGVSSACGNTNNHRFQYSLPSNFKDGKQHNLTVYAIGVDGNGNPNSVNPSLTGNPKSVTCAVAVSTPTPTPKPTVKPSPTSVPRASTTPTPAPVNNSWIQGSISNCPATYLQVLNSSNQIEFSPSSYSATTSTSLNYSLQKTLNQGLSYSVVFAAPVDNSVVVKYSTCSNCTSHPESSFVKGLSTKVVIPTNSSSYVDIAWKCSK